MSKFLLLLGPSGVGKSTIIEELVKLDNRFTYISPFMTRPLRIGEVRKVSVSAFEMDEMSVRGDLLVINKIYGIRYATPRSPIVAALSAGLFPVLDWPINKMEVMVQAFQSQLYVVYILPPSVEALRQRLSRDDRDIEGRRLASAHKELRAYKSSKYLGICDLEVISEDDKVLEAAQSIYSNYIQSSRK